MGALDDAFYDALVEDDPEELYDNAPCAYLSTLPDGTIVKVNQTFLSWTGYDRSHLIGRVRFQELLPPGDRIFYETHFAPALRMQGHVREIAVEIVGNDAGRLPVLVNSILKRDGRGDAVAVRTALFDATERRAYEKELLAARLRAEASEARATTLARTLQSTFLPPALIEIPGLEVGGGYRPAGDGSEVGGDFYDVFEISSDTWGVVIGDVCGKGATAAVVTSLARYTVRAESLRAPEPSVVLTRLHEVLLRYHPEQFCTAVFAVVRRGDDRWRMTVACGGHALPLLRHADGTTELVGVAGSILGMIDEADLQDAEIELRPGDAVVLYTDGVTEARRDGEFFGEERVRAAVAASDGGATRIAQGLVASAVRFQEGVTRDDIAVVVFRVDD